MPTNSVAAVQRCTLCIDTASGMFSANGLGITNQSNTTMPSPPSQAVSGPVTSMMESATSIAMWTHLPTKNAILPCSAVGPG